MNKQQLIPLLLTISSLLLGGCSQHILTASGTPTTLQVETSRRGAHELTLASEHGKLIASSQSNQGIVTFSLPLQPETPCVYILDEDANILPFRGLDTGGIHHPGWFELSKNAAELKDAQVARAELAAEALKLEEGLGDYQLKLENNEAYDSSIGCALLDPGPLPEQPHNACDPDQAEKIITETCNAKVFAADACSFAIQAFAKGVADLPGAMVGPLCGKMIAEHRNTQYTLKDVLIDMAIGAAMDLIEDAIENPGKINDTFVALIGAGIVAYKGYLLKTCRSKEQPACRTAYFSWQNKVAELQRVPRRNQVNCQRDLEAKADLEEKLASSSRALAAQDQAISRLSKIIQEELSESQVSPLVACESPGRAAPR